MNAGKLLQWRKHVGEKVQRGEIIADVETDKADIEVEVFSTGMIEKILIQPGEKVPVGTVMALIREEGKSLAAEAPAVRIEAAVSPAPISPAVPQRAAAAPPPTIEAGARRLHISPVAKKLADELGIDPANISGTGPGGRITLEDVQRGAQTRAAKLAEAAPELDRAARMRQAIGAAMARSKREIPHYYLSTTIDMSRAVAWLADENCKRSIEDRLVYSVLLVKAVAMALRQFPELNGLWVEGKAVAKPEIHVGVAISLRGGGLVAPALHNTDRQSLSELMKSFRDLVQRARAGSLRSSELTDPTITVTSLGEQGVEAVFGVIFPPQVALVGFGKIVERPCVSEGQIVARPTVTVTLSGDHRVSDGHRGGLFLAAVERVLQEPGQL